MFIPSNPLSEAAAALLLHWTDQVALMRKLDHRHIVKYIGVGFGDPRARSSEARLRSLFLVLELMQVSSSIRVSALSRLCEMNPSHAHKIGSS